MEPFRYEPLNLDRPAIRLLRLVQGEGNRIICDVFQAYLDDSDGILPYEALSYTWGIPDLSFHIELNGKRLGITNNLYTALRQLRSDDQDRILWVDAVCIDQSNPKERGHQVQQMGYIYRQAERVLFWLGQATYSTNVFLDSLQMFHEESARRASNRWKIDDPRWKDVWEDVQRALRQHHSNFDERQREGFWTLLNREWFNRVWILQEVENAQAALVCCGTRSSSARLFALVPRLLGFVDGRGYDKYMEHHGAVLEMMPGPARKEFWLTYRKDLYFLLRQFGSSHATESRDIVYALRGMSIDANDPAILTPDYEAPIDKLKQQLLRFLHFDGLDVEALALDSVSTVVRRLKELNRRAVFKCIEMGKMEDLAVLLGREEIRVDNELVASKLFKGETGKRMLCYLFEMGGKNVIVRRTAVSEVARRFDASTMEVLLRYRGSEIDIKSAIVHAAHGTGTLESIIKLRRDDVVRLADSVILDLVRTASYPKTSDASAYGIEISGGALVSFMSQLLCHGILFSVKKCDAAGLQRHKRCLLGYAAAAGNEFVVDELLRRGAVGKPDSLGQTPLCWAARSGHTSVVKILLRWGANPEWVTSAGQTALKLAEANGHYSTAGVISQELMARSAYRKTRLVEVNIDPFANGHPSTSIVSSQELVFRSAHQKAKSVNISINHSVIIIN